MYMLNFHFNSLIYTNEPRRTILTGSNKYIT